MKILIKNMVCYRCILAVKRILKELKLPVKKVSLGIVELVRPLTKKQLSLFDAHLKEIRLEILIDKRDEQVEEIKNLLITVINDNKLIKHFSVAGYISSHVNKNYTNLSKLFSQKEGITIEQYFILLKLEKVKELISYGEFTLKDIASELGYSSVQHLSAQFKKVFGLSTREFKNSAPSQRKFLDNVNKLK